MTAESAAQRQNMKELYNTTKLLSGKRVRVEKAVKGKNGRMLTSILEQKNQWKEHFEDLLNRLPPDTIANIAPRN
uniref:Uncharacterized protein n=1 Tax=Octopus bimaculoides TaxID=37653 RepID=A0A0L8FGI1_OCTBM